MNTRITYLYRDADNFKESESVVVSGVVRLSDLQPFLAEGLYFCPADVHLPHPGEKLTGGTFPGRSDDPWCELEADDFVYTMADATRGTAADLIAAFRVASGAGWPSQTEFYP